MGVQRRVHRPVQFDFPTDFPERLTSFKEKSGLSWKALARLLGVRPYSVRRWRKGTIPSSTHLFLLLTLADAMGLRDGVLMLPGRDLPREINQEDFCLPSTVREVVHLTDKRAFLKQTLNRRFEGRVKLIQPDSRSTFK